MAFDATQASLFAHGRDRDTAQFFAGRSAEIRRFDLALASLDNRADYDKVAEFIVYLGAPGCGKTSLVKHLQNERREAALFVDIGLGHLASVDALTKRVLDQVSEVGSLGGRIGAQIVAALRSRLRMRDAAKAATGFITARAAKGTKVVLHLDEAQEVDCSEQPGLLQLHTTGLAVPSVFVMTGLDHTIHSLGRIGGMSRLSSNAVVKMGAMAEDECVESTMMMLDEWDADGTDDEKSSAATTVAALSRGWPQHLHGAQSVLCRELIRTVGVLRDVDTEAVRRESDKNRQSHYFGRLATTVLADHPRFSALLIAKIDEQRPESLLALRGLCREQIESSGLSDLPDAREFANALIEKGAVSITLDGKCEVPIPSMVEWAETLATATS